MPKSRARFNFRINFWNFWIRPPLGGLSGGPSCPIRPRRRVMTWPRAAGASTRVPGSSIPLLSRVCGLGLTWWCALCAFFSSNELKKKRNSMNWLLTNLRISGVLQLGIKAVDPCFHFLQAGSHQFHKICVDRQTWTYSYYISLFKSKNLLHPFFILTAAAIAPCYSTSGSQASKAWFLLIYQFLYGMIDY